MRPRRKNLQKKKFDYGCGVTSTVEQLKKLDLSENQAVFDFKNQCKTLFFLVFEKLKESLLEQNF